MKCMTIPFALAICIFIINSAYCQDKDDTEGKLSQILRGLKELRDNKPAPTPPVTEAEEMEEKELDTDEKSNDLEEIENEVIRGSKYRYYYCRRRYCFNYQMFGCTRRVCYTTYSVCRRLIG